MSNNILLTGATGNAGQCVRTELVRRKIGVTALVRQLTTLEGCRTLVGDLATINRHAMEISNLDGIIHLASPRTLDHQSVIRTDIQGTAYLIDLWRKGAFIYASSPIICAIPPDGSLTEKSPVDPANWHDIGKMVNETQLKITSAISLEQRGPGISLRPGTFVTSNDRRNDRQYLSMVYNACRLNSKFVFDSEDGLETYGTSFIGGADMGRAVAESLALKQSGTYNVAGFDFTWKGLIQLINKHAGTRADFIVRADTQPQTGEFRVPQGRYYLDTRAFNQATGFVPQQSMDELIHNYVLAEQTAKTMPAPVPQQPPSWLDQFIETQPAVH